MTRATAKLKTDHGEFEAALQGLEVMSEGSPDRPLLFADGRPVGSTEFFSMARTEGIPYRTGCGMASRKNLTEEQRRQIRGLLFRARYVLDSRLEATVQAMIESGESRVERLLRRRVFGFCKKQGVSLRLSLSTCVPSELCGGGCYAHDGRERVTSTILSGCYNTLIARYWEAGLIDGKMLLPHIRHAVDLAKADAEFAESEYGITRRARIRLAHVGELAAYPRFANWLGQSIRTESDGRVDGVIYTRHPKVVDLDAKVMVVNLTVDESSENRRGWARKGIRVVWSAWNGRMDPTAEVNFLEHHDNGQHADPKGDGTVCPVTVASTEQRFCDAFHCTTCFDQPLAEALTTKDRAHRELRGTIRTRHQGLLKSDAKGIGKVNR